MGDRMKLRLLTVLATGGALALPPMAQAQVDYFERDRNIAVKDRPHPEYEALGVRWGAFRAYPRLQADLGYDSNIFATDGNEVSDTLIRLAPAVEVESDWSRHSLTAFAKGQSTWSTSYGSENYQTWSLGAAGRLDVRRRTNLGGGLDYAREVEPRTSSNSPQSIAEPIRYNQANAYVTGSHSFNRLRFSGRGDVRSYDYHDGVTFAGVPVPQSDRDQTTYEITGRADYAVSPATAVFARLSFNDRSYDSPGTALTPKRDSSGMNAIVGVDFELTNLVRGEAGIGYLDQSFDAPLYGSTSGLSTRVRLEYFPTQLLTLGLNANRSVDDSGVPGSGGYLSSNVQVTADYELRRNIIVEARAGFAQEDFDAIDRQNDRWIGGIRATYLLNRRFGVTAAYDFENRRSSGLDRTNDFNTHRIALSLVAQY
jgi:hypothetical protein